MWYNIIATIVSAVTFAVVVSWLINRRPIKEKKKHIAPNYTLEESQRRIKLILTKSVKIGLPFTQCSYFPSEYFRRSTYNPFRSNRRSK